MIYVIEDGKGNFKIGKASDPKRRLRELQTGNANKLRLLLTGHGFCTSTYETDGRRIDDFVAEKLLHDYYAFFRRGGEWFNFGEEQTHLLYNELEIYANPKTSDLKTDLVDESFAKEYAKTIGLDDWTWVSFVVVLNPAEGVDWEEVWPECLA